MIELQISTQTPLFNEISRAGISSGYNSRGEYLALVCI